MQRLLLLVAVLLISGCAQSGYKEFYKPFADPKTMADVEPLALGAEPKVYNSNNFDRDIRSLMAKRYIVIGQSSFNGGYEDSANAAAQAKAVGASVVLVGSKYSNTRTSTGALMMPTSQTTYASGSVYGTGGSGTFNGTSTTYGSTPVPFTVHQDRYDQLAVYLVKSTAKFRFGVKMKDLTPDQRKEIGRNAGALIDIVIEDTPAFYANVIDGDILVAVNGVSVKNSMHAVEVMGTVPASDKAAEFTVIRNGTEVKIPINL